MDACLAQKETTAFCFCESGTGRPGDLRSQSGHEWRRERATHCCGRSDVVRLCHVKTEVESVTGPHTHTHTPHSCLLIEWRIQWRTEGII